MKNRTPRWGYLLGIAAIAVLLAACTGGSPTGDEDGGSSSTVNVILNDFSISLQPSQAEGGLVNFVVKNNGSIRHDFAILGNGEEKKTPLIPAGETAPLTVYLEPGAYTYLCTIPGHEQLGMRGTFNVASP